MTASFNRTLRFRLPMMRGADVRAMQAQLYFRNFLRRSDIDALYGPTTRRAVRDFQASVGIEADGVAGPKTFAALSGGVADSTPDTAPDIDAAVPTRQGRLIPEGWMPPATMKRIILHWTAGTHTPSANDKAHYHVLIDGDGNAHRGKHSIVANVPPLRSKKYAAHTALANSHSIGLSICCMSKGKESPYDPGPFPITRAQWDAMSQAAAELCLKYGIDVQRTTVLGHGEVQDLLNRTQNGKWDPMVVPWDSGLPFRQVGDQIRADVRVKLDALRNPVSFTSPGAEEELVPLETVKVNGANVTGTRYDGQDWVDIEALASLFGWTGLSKLDDQVFVEIEDPPMRIAVETLKAEDGTTRKWAEIEEVSQKARLLIREQGDGSFSLESLPEQTGQTQRSIIVEPGQTLIQIARRQLGDASRWRDLRDESGQPFDEDSARLIRVGQLILLPDGTKTPNPIAPGGTSLQNEQIAAISRQIAASAPAFVGQTGRDIMADSAVAIIEACNRHGVNDPSHRAYILATANHETNLGRMIIEVWVPTATQRNYVGKLGNRTLAEAEKYKGRGFVQVTGRSNYERYSTIFHQDFTNDPDLLEDKVIAADVIVLGMSVHGFTKPGFVLADMGVDGSFDFFNARALINGDKNLGGDSRYPGKTKGQGIATTARKYLEFTNSA